MFTGKIYNVKQMAMWTRFETFRFLLLIIAWTSLYYFMDLSWLRIPWTPMALIGTAVAFVIGFQNNSVYSRIWEARKIWGGIVNTSRTFGVYVQDMLSGEHSSESVSEEEIRKEVHVLTYRHIAWMTALRFAMRQKKPWETTSYQKTNQEWGIFPPERTSSLEDELRPYLGKEDLEYTMSRDNHQTALLYLQSHHLKALKERKLIWEFSFL